MNSALASLGKNLILVAVVTLSVVNFFYSWLGFKELLAIQLIAGLAYVFLSCYEVLNASFKASLPVLRFSYFTNSYAMFRILKIGVFFTFAIMLFSSQTRIQYLYPICVIIALTEGIVTFLKYKKQLCFVSIYANYILFVQTGLVKLFASQIALIEFRHDIFYFVTKNKKSHQIKLIHIENKYQFIEALKEWIIRNKLNVSSESKLKMDAIDSNNLFN